MPACWSLVCSAKNCGFVRHQPVQLFAHACVRDGARFFWKTATPATTARMLWVFALAWPGPARDKRLRRTCASRHGRSPRGIERVLRAR
eukprot:2189827-Pleurochrysis_carterae.AAC.1